MQIGSKAKGIIVLGTLRKNYLTHCQILRSKTIYVQFNKNGFSI